LLHVPSLQKEIESFRGQGVQVPDLCLPKPNVVFGRTPAPARFAFDDLFPPANNGETRSERFTYDQTDPAVLHEVLETLLRDGHFVLQDVPSESGAVTRMGQAMVGMRVRPTNWGDFFNVEDKPDSGRSDIAYTN